MHYRHGRRKPLYLAGLIGKQGKTWGLCPSGVSWETFRVGIATGARPPKNTWQQEDPKVASVQERVIDIVAEQLGVSKDQITRETSFVNDLGADSLDTVELVMELEEEFDINIPDDAAEKIQTVGEAIKFIEKAQES